MSGKPDLRCPREDPVKQCTAETFVCPKCGGEVELWSDEPAGRCLACKDKIPRENLQKKP